MSDIFPKWTNRLPRQIAVGLLLVGTAGTAAIWYYCTPAYLRVGYEPIQPVPFSHNVHATQLGLDCRYCHTGVERSWYSNIPAASICMNCHTQVLKGDPRLEPVRQSFATGKPIPWVQVHITPDYVYFNHAVHVNRGISCVYCHGQVNKMDVVRHAKSFSMSFCLQCHRHPQVNIRPLNEVYNLNRVENNAEEKALGAKLVKQMRIDVPGLENCSNCHR